MPVHKVPALTVRLGTVLDATIEHEDARAFVEEWSGFQLLTDANAMERSPGRARLYLVKGKLQDNRRGKPRREVASDTYKRWHERDPDKVGELETKPARYLQGRMQRIGYRSDKWHKRGRTEDYDHDFYDDGGAPPLVYTDTRTLEAATTIVVVGGSMRVTERGIA